MIPESIIFACCSGLVLIVSSIWSGHVYYRSHLGMSKPQGGRFVTCFLVALTLAVTAWAILRAVFRLPNEEGGPPVDVVDFAGYIVLVISGLLSLTILSYCILKAHRELSQKPLSSQSKPIHIPNTHEP